MSETVYKNIFAIILNFIYNFCTLKIIRADMTNKRRHKRFPLTGSAVITFPDQENDDKVNTIISDISRSGLGLYSDVPLKDNVDVSVEIKFISADGLIKTDFIEGHIVYVRKFGEMYFLGIQFHNEVNPTNQPFLNEHLQKIDLLNL